MNKFAPMGKEEALKMMRSMGARKPLRPSPTTGATVARVAQTGIVPLGQQIDDAAKSRVAVDNFPARFMIASIASGKSQEIYRAALLE